MTTTVFSRRPHTPLLYQCNASPALTLCESGEHCPHCRNMKFPAKVASPDRGLQATSLFELIKANLRPMRLGNIEAA